GGAGRREGAGGRRPGGRAVAGVRPAVRPLPRAAPGADGNAAAQLRRGRRGVRAAARQHRPHQGALLAAAPRRDGRYQGRGYALFMMTPPTGDPDMDEPGDELERELRRLAADAEPVPAGLIRAAVDAFA